VAEGLATVLHGWRPVPATGRAATRVSAAPDGYDVASDYLDTPMTGLPVASAVCAVIADLVQSWADERAGMLALHAGAVRTGAGLVALTGPARAGKSTLTARLGLEPDGQVFCDDVLPVAPVTGLDMAEALATVHRQAGQRPACQRGRTRRSPDARCGVRGWRHRRTALLHRRGDARHKGQDRGARRWRGLWPATLADPRAPRRAAPLARGAAKRSGLSGRGPMVTSGLDSGSMAPCPRDDKGLAEAPDCATMAGSAKFIAESAPCCATLP